MELLAVIVILSLLVTIASKSAERLDEDVKVAAALKDMKAIQTALVERVLPDLGYIPCGVDAAATPARRTLEALFVPAYPFLERSGIQQMLGALDCLRQDYISDYDPYQSTGWRGPYMSGSNGTIDATDFDPAGFPATAGGAHVHLDAMLTPWAGECETLAVGAEDAGDPDLAREYRKGKYYQVLYPQITVTAPVMSPFVREGAVTAWTRPTCEIPRDGSYIVCRGPDCLPPKTTGADLDGILACTAKIREQALSQEACGKITSAGVAAIGSLSGLKACVKQAFTEQFAGCFKDKDPVPLDKRLGFKDPGHPYHIDIGDDLVMSLSGEVVRSPLDD